MCSVNNCNKKIYARGWCRTHYRHVVEGGHKEPIEIVNECQECSVTLSGRVNKSGLCSTCYRERWERTTNWDQKQYRREYYSAHKKQIKKQVQEWRHKNRDYENQYYAKKRKDPLYKIAHNLRSRLYDFLKGRIKHKNTQTLTGCSFKELMSHLESKFTKGMSWDNYGKWHIDHIKPLASFDLLKPKELEKACHYSNLQPLWAKDNLKKGNKYEK